MGELAALSASALWAVASVIFTGLSRDHGAVVMNLLKCLIALLMMLAALVVLEGVIWPTSIQSSDAAILAASGIVGLTIGDSAFFSALTRVGPRRALLMMALVPATTALLAVPVLGEMVTTTMTLGIGLTIAGIAWVVRERATDEEAGSVVAGFGFALLAMLCQSTGNVLTKLGGADVSALGVSVIRVTAGTVGLFVFLGLRGRLSGAFTPLRERQALGRVVVATFLGTFLGIWLLNAGLKYTSHAGVAATLSSTSPIFILPLAWWFLKERLSPRAVVGALIAVAGIAVLFVQ